MYSKSKIKAKHINDPLSLQIKTSFSYALETGWRSGVWSCIMPGLPTHLVQELDVSTVVINPLNSQNGSS